jgi:hypothetical protein
MLRRYRIPILLAIAALWLIYLIAFRWQTDEQVSRNHTRFIESIEAKKWSRCTELISPNYGDRWGYNRQDMSLALKDVGRQFTFAFDFGWKLDHVETVAEGQHYKVIGSGQFTGKGGPLASAIEQYAAKYAGELFTFHWKKQSWLPWDWKLEKIEHPTLTIPSGYKPGDLQNSMADF